MSQRIVSAEYPFRVIDIKQWVYCPRILFYYTCLPDVRPITYKIVAGIEAGQQEEGREERRSLKNYGLKSGRREFNVPVSSTRLGMTGSVDMLIWIKEDDVPEVIPVDYKLSKIAGEHFKIQLACYGMLIEESFGATVKKGFLYFIPLRKAEEVKIDTRIRKKITGMVENMQRMLITENMPEPTNHRERCISCEFKRFCNDCR